MSTKIGPNNINKGDIKTIMHNFVDIRNLARVNHLPISGNDLIVGVLYGTHADLNNHFIKIFQHYPIYTGADFWHHLTGQPDFYLELIGAIGEVALEVDGRDRMEAAISLLAADIAANL